MPPSRWLSWAAVSSLPQAKKISIDDQLQINRDHAAKHGGQIVAELVVPGESRSIVLFEDAARKIEAYAKLKELIDARAFDVLAYLDRSRLGRTAALSMTTVELCHAAGILCYETDNPPATLDRTRGFDDDLLGAIKSVGAQQEVRKLIARRAGGMLGRAKRGLNPMPLPYGYTVRWSVADSGERAPVYAVDAPAAAIVRRIIASYLAGAGTPTIARTLSAEAVPSPSGATTWTREMVINILNHIWRYAGYVEFNADARSQHPLYRGRGAWEPLIDEATLQAVLTERHARHANRKLADTQHLLSGVVYCTVCEGVMSIHRATNYGRLTDYLRCLNHTPSTRIRTDVVIDALRTLIADLATRDLDALLTADDSDSAAIAAQLQAQATALAANAKAKERADTAYIDGNLDPAAYAAQVRRLRAVEAHIRAEVERLDTLAAIEAQRSTRRARLDELVADGLAMLDSPAPTAANAWLRRHLRIWVTGKQIDIEWL